MQIQISWLLQKPTDLDLHCLQRQDISGLSRTRVKLFSSYVSVLIAINSHPFQNLFHNGLLCFIYTTINVPDIFPTRRHRDRILNNRYFGQQTSYRDSIYSYNSRYKE